MDEIRRQNGHRTHAGGNSRSVLSCTALAKFCRAYMLFTLDDAEADHPICKLLGYVDRHIRRLIVENDHSEILESLFGKAPQTVGEVFSPL